MYEVLANIYDSLMHDVDYKKWAAFLVQAIKQHNATAKLGADLACGTGEITIALKKAGFDILGLDLSPHMLLQARQKAKAAGEDIVFVEGDLQSFSLFRPQDFITINCDGLNYVASPKKVFCAVKQNLKDDGVFVFDISTEYKLTTILGNNTFYYEQEHIDYVWQNTLGKNKIDFDLTFFQTIDGKNYKKLCESQTQYIHSRQKILQALDQSGFVVAGEYDESFGKPSKTAQRLYFVCTSR